jgi:uncharacterized repeat protein (TIGR03803 family)
MFRLTSLSVLAAALMSGPLAAQTPGFSTVVEFTGITGAKLGSEPGSALLEHSDGNLYGTTLSGGFSTGTTTGYGTVYKLTKAGIFSNVVTFTGATGAARGFAPWGTLAQHSDGSLYGTCAGLSYENPNAGITFAGFGNTFKTTTSGLYTFFFAFSGSGQPNRGRKPIGGFVLVGNEFFGSTDTGGVSSNLGTLFRMSATGTNTYLLDFTGTGLNNRGSQPNARMINGNDGYLYGTTLTGGAGGHGTLFRYHIANGTLNTLVEFTGTSSPTPGKSPADALCLASDGHLYGTTANGGALNAGTVFRYNRTTSTFTTLAEFTDLTGAAQGAGPFGGLVQGPDGFLYGVTQYGGPQPGDHGTLYRISLSGQLTPRLIDFTGTTGVHKGSQPYGGLIKTAEGVIYGTTLYGGPATVARPSGNGTVFKLDTSLLPQPPTVTTGAASAISETGATLNGVVNPRGLATAWQFEYGTTTSYGNNAPVTAGTLAAGSADQNVSTVLGGLAPNTTYHFRLRASSTAGLTSGANGTFTTGTVGPNTPLVVTGSATNVTADSVTLGGTVNPRGSASTWQFEYGLTTSYGSVIPVPAGTTGSGSTAEPVTVNLTGLPSGVTIHYRLKATNTAGTSHGNDATFATTGTPVAPIVVTGTASGITGTSAVLNGTVNPRGSVTEWQFKWGSDVTVSSGVVPVTPASIGNGITAEAVNVPLTGLTAGATYFYQLTAENSAGTTNGSIGSFTTAIAPEAVTQAAVGITNTAATLTGTVDPNGSATAWQFDYGPDTSYGSVAPALPGTTGSGTAPEIVATNLTGLAPGTTIHFRLRAVNGAGTSLGADFSFTTKQPPTIVTGTVQNLTANGATLTGTVNPHGSAATWQFEYGTTASYGTLIPAVAGTTGSGNAPENVSAVLSGLSPNTLYHFRLRATNANGTSLGPDTTFTTGNNLAGWRQQNFGTSSNTGNAANTADPDFDGVINLLEYAYGMNPNVKDQHLLPVPAWNGSNLIASFTSPVGVNDILYGAEVSTTLANSNSWAPLADGGSGRVHTFSAPVSPVGRNWMRLRVTVIP